MSTARYYFASWLVCRDGAALATRRSFGPWRAAGRANGVDGARFA